MARRKKKDEGAIKLGAQSARPTEKHVDDATSQSGWIIERLVLIESMIWGRWSYWLACLGNGTIQSGPDWAIPRVEFQNEPDSSITSAADRMIANGVDSRIIKALGTGHEAKSHVERVLEHATRQQLARLTKG